MASSFSLFYPSNNMQYAKYARDIRISLRESFIRSIDSQKPCLHHKLPKIELLKDCIERPYFQYYIIYESIE